MNGRIVRWGVAGSSLVAWIAGASAGCSSDAGPSGGDAAASDRDARADGTYGEGADASRDGALDAPSDRGDAGPDVGGDGSSSRDGSLDGSPGADATAIDAADAGEADAWADEGGLGVGFDGGACVLRTAPCAGAIDLLTNGSFEIGGAGTGAGLLPTGWIQVNPGADTFSSDGSFGLAPAAGNAFPGVAAQDGLRWVAAASQAPGRFGAATTTAFVTGRVYRVAAFMRRATARPDDGTYELSVSSALPHGAERVVGAFCPLDAASAWQERSFDFVAPGGGPFVAAVFTPEAANALFDAYPGLDTVSITDVTACR